MAALYIIKDYEERYKPYDRAGRDLVNAAWVKLPAKPAGDGLRILLKQKRGLEVFGIWCLLLEKTTTQRAEHRGKLLNHRDKPATIPEIAASISLERKIGLVKYAVSLLVSMGWIIQEGQCGQSEDGASSEVHPLMSPKSSVVKSRVEKSRVEKSRYLDFVFLTEDEYKKLIEKFGEKQTTEFIEELNNYIGSKGRNYKSHYHTILAWAAKRERERGQRPETIDEKFERMKREKKL